jgi:hypothetical protein
MAQDITLSRRRLLLQVSEVIVTAIGIATGSVNVHATAKKYRVASPDEHATISPRERDVVRLANSQFHNDRLQFEAAINRFMK